MFPRSSSVGLEALGMRTYLWHLRFPSHLTTTLAGAWGGAGLGGGHSCPSGASRQIHLLPVRGRLVCLLPSRGGHPLLWGRGPRLAEARSGGCAWLSLSPAAPTDTSSGQQVLRSGGRKHVHRCGFKWRQSWWWVPQWRYPSCRGASCGLGGRGHGHIAHRQGHP